MFNVAPKDLGLKAGKVETEKDGATDGFIVSLDGLTRHQEGPKVSGLLCQLLRTASGQTRT